MGMNRIRKHNGKLSGISLAILSQTGEMKRHEDEQEAIAPTSSVTSEPMRTPNRRARGKERQSHEEGERYEKATALNTVQLCAATAKARYSSSCRSDQSGSIQETALIYNQQNREAPGQLVVAPHFK